ncbi:MAG: hypothetical protein R3C69_06035 [Geminicoccaceae bacterium]
MAILLDQIIPLGRTMAEYVGMFGLTEADRHRTILGCGDGPAGFNAEWSAGGGRVVSVDPLYRHAAPAIRRRIDTHLRRHGSTAQRQPAALRLAQHSVDGGMAAHAPAGHGPVPRRLRRPESPWPLRRRRAAGPAFRRWHAFDLALCSHLLFLYSEQLSYAFHLAAMRELLRVAREVRVFPLLTLAMEPSPHLPPLSEALAGAGFGVAVERVPYEFQRGGNEMLRVVASRV